MTSSQTEPSSAPIAMRSLKAGVSEAMIRRLVETFYASARTDPTLGPIFERVVGQGWDHHLPKMCDFWSAVMLGTRRFSGAPVQAHGRIPDLERSHFERWLELFRGAAGRVCPPQAAALFIARAEAIAESLQAAMAARAEAGASEARAVRDSRP